MKKNILLGLMLLSAVPAFSADPEIGNVAVVAPRGGIRGWFVDVLPVKYITHQTVYGVAGAGGAYTAAHCTGASDGWLGWIGLGGLCGGLYLGSRHYRSAEHETGVLTGARDAAEALAAERQRTIGLRDTALLEAATVRGQIEGVRDTALAEVANARQRLTDESQRHAIAEARSAEEIQRLSGTVAEGLGEVQRTLGVNQGGLRILLGTQIATIRSHRVNSIAAGVTLRGVGRGDDAAEADAAVLALDGILPGLQALDGQVQGASLLALPE